MARIYTRTGDDGTTALFGAGRVPKDHPRVEAYGTVDETGAVTGVAVALMADDANLQPIREVLEQIQSDLFVLGSDLATPTGENRYPVPRIEEAHITRLERWIDRFDAELPPLRSFILPGGTLPAAQLHVCRTVCRRAERAVIHARGEIPDIRPETIRYLNRLSDLFFVLARWANHRAGIPDVPWKPPEHP